MAGWNDYADWSDPNSLRLCEIYNPLYAVCAALNERLALLGLDSEWIFEISRLQQITEQIGRSIIFNPLDFDTIDKAIAGICPYFVNLTDSSDFTGAEEVPYWSINDLYSHTTAGEKLNFYSGNLISADYLYQVYEILNMLYAIPGGGINIIRNSNYGQYVSYVSAYDAVDMAINAATGSYLRGWGQWTGVYDDSYGKYYGYAYASQFQLSIGLADGDYTGNWQADYYLKAAKGRYGFPDINEIFDSGSLNLLENKYKKIWTGSGSGSGEENYQIMPIYPDSFSYPKYPDIPGSGDSAYRGWHSEGGFVALSFNVTGGFQFQ